MAENGGSRLENILRNVRPRNVDDFPPRDWKDAAADQKPRGIPDPTSPDRYQGQTPAKRKKE